MYLAARRCASQSERDWYGQDRRGCGLPPSVVQWLALEFRCSGTALGEFVLGAHLLLVLLHRNAPRTTAVRRVARDRREWLHHSCSEMSDIPVTHTTLQ